MNRESYMGLLLDNAEDEVDALRAVADAAVIYIHAMQSHAAGIPDKGRIGKSLKNLVEEVAAFEEWEQDL